MTNTDLGAWLRLRYQKLLHDREEIYPITTLEIPDGKQQRITIMVHKLLYEFLGDLDQAVLGVGVDELEMPQKVLDIGLENFTVGP